MDNKLTTLVDNVRTLESGSLESKLQRLAKLYKDKNVDTLIPLMCMFKIKDKIYNLKNHFQFEPLFKLKSPKRTVLKCARQVGKSQNVGGRNLITSWAIPFFRTLYISPRFEQTKRYSNDVIREMVENSPFKGTFVDSKTCDQSILERSYTNNSKQYFSFAFLDADRIRCISDIEAINFDETQDINSTFIPIIEMVSSVANLGLFCYSGTPKTTDNTLTDLWNESSQAEWVTQCPSCNHFNIACIEEDLLRMIGAETCICSKCGKPLDCSLGTYVHRFAERRASFQGYHVSQITHPIHYSNKAKWDEIHVKMRRYPKHQFYNEVLGTEFDSSEKLITIGQLEKICSDRPNTLEAAYSRIKDMHIRSMGIDWSGGGDITPSYTAIALGGDIRGSDHIEVVYGIKLSRNLQVEQETEIILKLFRDFNPTFVAHDYGGAGALRETLMLQAGIPLDRIIPYTYVCSANQAIIEFNKPTRGYRSSYSLDKSRSLVVLCTMMKAGKISFPSWDTIKETNLNVGNESLLMDFTHLNEERIERPRGSDIVLIGKTPKKSDDFAHAVNYCCSSIWYANQRYPNLAEAMSIKLSYEDLQRLDPEMNKKGYNW